MHNRKQANNSELCNFFGEQTSYSHYFYYYLVSVLSLNPNPTALQHTKISGNKIKLAQQFNSSLVFPQSRRSPVAGSLLIIKQLVWTLYCILSFIKKCLLWCNKLSKTPYNIMQCILKGLVQKPYNCSYQVSACETRDI